MDYINCVDPSNVMHRKHGVGTHQHYDHILNPPIHPGALHAPMPQYYVLPDQRRIERVPRPSHLSPPWESTSPITFSTNGFPGVRASKIYKGTIVVDAANDPVFEEHAFRSIVVSIEWPGYNTKSYNDHMHARIDVRPDGRPITRRELAREISGLFVDFHKSISKYPIAPDCEKWALTAGPEGIRVSDIVLFSLHYYRNVWIPELYVIE